MSRTDELRREYLADLCSTLRAFVLAGHDVHVVGNGAEAVEAVRQRRFDLVLMDVAMPEMDGVDAARAIRQLSDRHVPIIALTANAEPEDAQHYLDAGMNGVVEKPMKPEHLLTALQQALGETAAAA